MHRSPTLTRYWSYQQAQVGATEPSTTSPEANLSETLVTFILTFWPCFVLDNDVSCQEGVLLRVTYEPEDEVLMYEVSDEP